MGQDTSQNKDRIAGFLRDRNTATNAALGTDQPDRRPTKYRAAVKGLNTGVKAPKRPGTPGGEAPQSVDEIKARIDRLLGGR